MTSREKVLTRLDSTGIRREDEAAVPVNGVTVPLPYMVIRSWAWEMPFLILYSLIAVIFSIASLSITMCDHYSITKRDCQH